MKISMEIYFVHREHWKYSAVYYLIVGLNKNILCCLIIEYEIQNLMKWKILTSIILTISIYWCSQQYVSNNLTLTILSTSQ